MAGRNLNLEVVLAGIDKLSPMLNKIKKASGATADQLKENKDRLKALQKAQADIDSFRKLRVAARKNARQMDELSEKSRINSEALRTQRETHVSLKSALKTSRREYDRLAKEIAATTEPSAELSRQLDLTRIRLGKNQEAFERSSRKIKNHKQAIKSAGDALDGVRGKYRRQIETIDEMGASLKEAGYDTRAFKGQQNALGEQIEQTNAQLERQKEKLAQVAARQRAANAAASKYSARMQRSQAMIGAGTSAMVGGAVTLVAPVKFLYDFSNFEDAMLGVAKQMPGARNAAGALTAKYYDMANAIKQMAEVTPMATTDLARLAESALRMGVEGQKNVLKFVRTVAMMATAFDLPADQIGEDMGKIANLYKVPIKNITALGDAINWLDDNALSAGGDIIEVLKRMAGMAQTVNMGFREAAALGSTFLSTGTNRAKAASAANAIMRELAMATAQGKKFKQTLERIGLSAEAVQKGMATNATSTILKVMEAIKRLPEAEQLTAIMTIFGKNYGDTIAKLVKNTGEYRRQLALVKSEAADDSMLREFQARIKALSAQARMSANRFFNLSALWGKLLKAAAVDLLHTVNDLLEAIVRFTKQNPELVSTLLKAAAVLGALVAVGGALTLTLGALLGPIALLRYGMAMVGIKGFAVVGGIKAAGGALKTFAARIPAVITGLRGMRLALVSTGIGAIAVGIGMAAALIIKYWQPIAAFFKGVAQGIGQALFGVVGALGPVGDALKWVAGLIGDVIGWFANLFKPVDASAETLNKAASAGRLVGRALTYVLIPAIAALTGPIGWLSFAAYMIFKNWSRLADLFVNIGNMIVSGLTGGMFKSMGELWRATKEVFGSIIDWVKGIFGIASPSRVFAAIGGDIIAGLLGAIARLPATLTQAILSGLQTLIKTLPQHFMSLGKAIVGGIISGIKSMPGAITDAVTGLASGAVSVGADIASGVGSGIVGGAKAVGGAAADLAGGTVDAAKWVLGINSPSKVFEQIGMNTVEGYRLGVIKQQQAAVNDVNAFARRVRQAGAGIALATAATAAAAMPALQAPDLPALRAPALPRLAIDPIRLDDMRFDTRPPVPATHHNGGDVHYNVTVGDIHAAPGMDESALAQYVAAEVQRTLATIERQRARNQRAGLYDQE